METLPFAATAEQIEDWWLSRMLGVIDLWCPVEIPPSCPLTNEEV